MSCFYTVKQIGLGRVPAVEDFSEARTLVTRALLAEPAILGAIFCGSSLGKPARSSDMDVVVLYDSTKVREAFRMLRYCTSIASSVRVPLELICLDDQFARLGAHGIYGSFAVHLQGCIDRGGLVKENPLEIMRLQEGSLFEQLRGYVQGKLHKVQKLMARVNRSQQDEFALCREILDTPVHIARKYLRATNCVLESDTSSEVCRVFDSIASGECNELLARLRKARLEYDQGLDRLCQIGAGAGDRLTVEHAWVMRAIGERAFDALAFLRTIGLVVARGTSS